MKYFIVKLKWSEPKDGGEDFKRFSKRFLVRADSVTEAEARVLNWIPSNYQDPEIPGADEADVTDLVKDGDSEVWWYFGLSDENEKGRFVPFSVVINGGNEKEVLTKITSKLYQTSQFESMKRFKAMVDDDLISEEINKKKPGLIQIDSESGEIVGVGKED
jgi:hypothetical protein